MAIPDPAPGLVIHYQYLWRHEYEAGEDTGRKARPCVVIVAVLRDEGSSQTVAVAPITHSKPKPPHEGVEIPPRVKRHLGLDDSPSWAISTDLNVFKWPGVDLRARPTGEQDGGREGESAFSYGFIPPKLFDALRAAILSHASAARATPRSD